MPLSFHSPNPSPNFRAGYWYRWRTEQGVNCFTDERLNHHAYLLRKRRSVAMKAADHRVQPHFTVEKRSVEGVASIARKNDQEANLRASIALTERVDCIEIC